MKKLLADLIAATDFTPYPETARARDLLRLPQANHVCSAHPVPPLVDRISFDRNAWGALRPLFADDVSRAAAFSSIRFPKTPLWIEVDRVWGWLFVPEGQNTECVFFQKYNGVALPLFNLGSEFLADERRPIRVASAFSALASLPSNQFEETSNSARLIGFALAALASPRVTTLRRVVTSESNAARAMARRRHQSGRPVFSYNQVDMVLPKTALHRGVVRQVPERSGVARHLVIGHWRLIDGAVEPCWIWIDGHERGDRSIGTIVKARHVSLVADVRRGFQVPGDVGVSGERRRAARGGST